MSLKSSNAGFTLLELLVVMIIVGLGFVTLAPRLAENTVSGSPTEKLFNDTIASHLSMAKELNRQVFIKGTKGSNSLTLADGKTVKIPVGNIFESRVNGENTENSTYEIYFYPDGLFDEFELKTQSGKLIKSDPMRKTAVMR